MEQVGGTERTTRTVSKITASKSTIRTVVTATPDPATLRAWEQFVLSTPDSDVAQLPAWARVRGSVGYEPLYLLCRRDGVLVGGAQVLRRRVPLLGWVGYLPYGPLAQPDSADGELWDALADGLEEIGRRHLRALFVQPTLHAGPIGDRLLHRGFRRSAADVAPGVSLRIDLRTDETTLSAAASKRWRMWKNRWPKRGVTTRIGDESDIGLLADLLARSASHHGSEPMSAEYLRCLYRELDGDDAVRLFVGEVDSQAVAAQLFTGCGGVLRPRFIGMDRSSPAASLKVPGALVWAAISWAKANGYHEFDWCGIEEATADTLLSGQPVDWDVLPGKDQFKASFGGTAVRYPPAVELFSSTLVRRGYDLFRRSDVGGRVVAKVERLLRGGSGDPNPASATDG